MKLQDKHDASYWNVNIPRAFLGKIIFIWKKYYGMECQIYLDLKKKNPKRVELAISTTTHPSRALLLIMICYLNFFF